MLPSRCPHCKAELPDQGRFCVMCGRRIEGWGGLLPTSLDASPEAVKDPEPTRPVPPSPSLLLSASGKLDAEALRPTREVPVLGRELRSKAPDHRVLTS